MLGVSKDIDECAAGLTPQFTIFPFFQDSQPLRGHEKEQTEVFISKYKPILRLQITVIARALRITVAIIIVITIRSVT